MFGNNPKRKIQKGDGSHLFVQEIFKTFQGEAIFAGYPAIFIRLGGCNLACDFCDTEFEDFTKMSLETITNEVNILSGKKDGNITHKLVVITGGEPFRQPIAKLCDILLSLDYQVQIETNGTLYRDISEKVHIICSPKNTNNGYYKIREDLLSRINAFKFLISANKKEYYDIADVGQTNQPIYLQPMDEYNQEKNDANLKHTIQLASEKGYRISLQIHKIMNID